MPGPKTILTLFDLPPAAPTQPTPSPAQPPREPGPKIHSVVELLRLARGSLEQQFPKVYVQGEVSDFSTPASGHWYFSLKDQSGTLKCVMWASDAATVKVRPARGMQVVVRARATIYESKGDFQLQVSALKLSGDGEQAAAFEALKAKLQSEGLFAQARKKALPQHARSVGVVTSLDGAALKDIFTVLGRRAPHVRVVVSPARVQGLGAAAEVARALQRLDAHGRVDVIIVGRGGGSAEDLWAFNDEALCRVLAACRTPIISAVGHETDFTMVDFVADVRAPTPSAAAELAVPDRALTLQRIAQLQQRMSRAMLGEVQRHKFRVLGLNTRLGNTRALVRTQAQRLDELEARLNAAHPAQRVREQHAHLRELDGALRAAMKRHWSSERARFTSLRQRLHGGSPLRRVRDQLSTTARVASRLNNAMRTHAARKRERFLQDVARLHALSPLAVLTRGYAVVTDARGRVVRAPADAPAGETLSIRLQESSITAVSQGHREKP